MSDPRATRLPTTPDALGESPVWDDARGRVWWIDGVAGKLRGLDLDSSRQVGHVLGGHLGSVALASDGLLLIARDHEIALCDPATGALALVLTLHSADPAMRLNDGKTDRQGRFLCAGMGRGGAALGALHQIDGAGGHRVLTDGLRIGNGICFSPAGDVLYFTDTPARAVSACDYDPETGRIGPIRAHIDTAPLETGVDGATVDRDGNLWAALITVGQIGCFAPDGRLIDRLAAPVDLPSSLAFAGPGLDRLIVTSIRDSGTGRAVSRHPDGGGLFVLDGLGVVGLPETPFALPSMKV